MPRSIWTGAISFGLVNVPVKLYSAVSSKSVRFNQLHAEDGGRIRQKRVCSVDGEEVPFEEIVKGYEIGPERYVLIEPAELDALDPKATRTIDIEDFVDLADIDPVYFDHPYYLAPSTGAAKSYKLLLEAMRESGKVAIARVVLRSKQYLCALRASEAGVLTLSTMNYGDEVVSPDTLDELDAAGEVESSDRELAMAQQLIDSLTSEWDPTKYRDDYREQVLELIERKAAGEEVAIQPADEEPAEVPDLMAALEASLASVRTDRDDADDDGAKGKKGAASNGGSASGSKGKGKGKSGSGAKAKAGAKS